MERVPAANSSTINALIDAKAYYDALLYLLNICFSLGITIYGFSLLANSVVIYIFFKEGFKSTSNISFFALGITDILVSICWLFFNVRWHTQLARPYFDQLNLHIWKYVVICADAMSSVGSWITAVITWERLCCIAFPLKVKRIFTRKLIARLIVGGFVYEVVALVLYFVADYIIDKENSRQRAAVYYADGSYRLNYTAAATFGSNLRLFARLSLTYIPNYALYAAIVIGTVILVAVFLRSVQVKQQLTANKDSQKMSTKEKKLIKSVIGVCLIYIVTCTPRNVYQTMLSLSASSTNSLPTRFAIMLQRYVEIVLSFNHAVNILVYLMVNSSFRERFMKLFCFCYYGKRVVVDPPAENAKENKGTR
ncbi:peptide receptor GPCR [Elysia marginata]|uniref:Peptide receptor GPCR n=1 Tax=Elysia marginata TaxID=1093978 RepID=A0AAV4JXI3_9GAST|nr:peptide receptor GPCR [Elysia marginata]